MGTRSRRRHPSKGNLDRERSLLDAIADGRLDDHLTAVADGVHARQHLLRTVRSAAALASLCPGDPVRINDAASPRYLIGMQGTVVDVDDRAATIRLLRPIGRFHSGQVRCPPLALEKLARVRP